MSLCTNNTLLFAQKINFPVCFSLFLPTLLRFCKAVSITKCLNKEKIYVNTNSDTRKQHPESNVLIKWNNSCNTWLVFLFMCQMKTLINELKCYRSKAPIKYSETGFIHINHIRNKHTALNLRSDWLPLYSGFALESHTTHWDALYCISLNHL